MGMIEWQDNFSVGIASVDHEHRELIDALGGLAETGASEVGAGCPQGATMQRHELENSLEMHSMMLDMVE